MGMVLSHISPAEICGITVNKLSAEMEFISLCLHHYKDINSIYLLYMDGFKLNHFCDIYFYLLNNELDRQKLISLWKELNVESYVYYCIYYTNLMFISPVLSEYLTLFEQGKDPQMIDSFGLCDNERKTWCIDFYQRLLHPKLKEYLDEYLTENDKRKIYENQLNM